MAQRRREVVSADGVRLAVYEVGSTKLPTVVAVHGYPDNHRLWDDIAEELSADFHVVTYDVRGAGASDKPKGRAAYRMDRLTDDLLAVLDATSPNEPVHLVGHDWGSIQLWPAIVDKRLAGRVASFTSISGPSLDYAGAWLRQVGKHPAASLRQLAHSYYIMLFQLPGLPEFAARRGVISRGVQRAGARSDVALRDVDARYGIQLYRANMLSRITRPRPLPASVPVQLVVADQDPFVNSDTAIEGARPWVPNLSVVKVPGGHWALCEHPQKYAQLIRDFAQTPAASSSASISSSR